MMQVLFLHNVLSRMTYDGEIKDINCENNHLDFLEKFSDTEYDDLDDFDVSECAVKEFINGTDVRGGES